MTEAIYKESMMSYRNLARMYFNCRTDAPSIFGEVTSLQSLGHAFGHNVINSFSPGEIHYNSYVLLIGDSTLSRKSTVQGIGKSLYPQNRQMASEVTPERILESLSEHNEQIQYQGEFSRLQKSIHRSDYQSHMAEYLNDLFSCDPFSRELKSKPKKINKSGEAVEVEKTSYHIEKPYLSTHSTITEEVLKQYLNTEMFSGGLMARQLCVHGIAHPRPRERLPLQIDFMRKTLTDVIQWVIEMCHPDEKDDRHRYTTVFELSDKAIEKYHEIENLLYNSQSYMQCGAFVGRYLNYIPAFADILQVSNGIGYYFEHGMNIQQARLAQLGYIPTICPETVTQSKDTYLLPNYTNDTNSTNCANDVIKEYVPTQSRYIEESWQTYIKPCLDYVLELRNYVDLDKPVAKLRAYLQKHATQAPVSHSQIMRDIGLSSFQMDNAVRTMYERSEIDEETLKTQGSGRAYEYKVYKYVKPQGDN